MPSDPPDTQRQVQFTRHFAEAEGAMKAFAFSLVPNRADAEDVIQETLKALWEHFDDYDPDRPFLPWANRFVYRQVQMHRRSQATRGKYFFSDETIEQLAGDPAESPEQSLAMSRALEQCLEHIGAKQRELIEQRYTSKGTLQELAQQLGKKPDALYKMLQRVREALHQCICQRMTKEGFHV
ncbi:MAG: sigma-70 family RNA polymerase sigma factor [Verrucomicrobiota bacterium]